ncbi:TIGR02302 family protein [Profundibacterium mesophilum]|uniref:Fibrillarin n=1 Tax=Profundibacterium mesophilum KAUST100406-0324 TaxID=1037889 RepID=A0A921NRR6_9RHOB|nr:TIGR02302 family protein [Profundibacterium mesophilum]KAF0676472.1 fibrillarin [Profundibacterium mesophilum KAUST100406-0324]
MIPKLRLSDDANRALRRPVALTRAGMLAERITYGFWPFWSLLIAALAALMFGLPTALPLEAGWTLAVLTVVALFWTLWRGLRRFSWPSHAEALDRLDRTMAGRPITALTDAQAAGAADPASAALWRAHQDRMARRLHAAAPVRPDLRLAARDPFALRYVALLCFVIALLFGSVMQIANIAGMAGPGAGGAQAAGPSWEGWIEPPAHTGRPGLYLGDLGKNPVEVPQGSEVTLRLYGEIGALTVAETVSGRTGDAGSAADAEQSFEIAQSGTLRIDGPGGRGFDIVARADAAPRIAAAGPVERAAGGTFRQAFTASDDYGVEGGQAVITLDLDAVDRRHGLAAAPDERAPLTVDLPMPIAGSRTKIAETLIEEFGKHPWANLPVRITYEARDGAGQSGLSEPVETPLAGQRFFDPLAQAVIEQRRDLLWARSNGARVAAILRAVSWNPDTLFSDDALYLRLRVAIRRLEAGIAAGALPRELQEEIAEELWQIADRLEFGDLSDARDRLRRAQERLSEAMQNGASPAEIAELMDELRAATDAYMEQLAERAEAQDSQQAQAESEEITGDQLQQMLDRIQELMEQGRMEEAQRLLDQLAQMMENMQVAQGQGGETGQQGDGQGQGQQAMQDLRETLRQQQELSDDAFRDLQERFNQDGTGTPPGQNPQGGGGQDGMEPGDQGAAGQGEGQGQGQGAGRDGDRSGTGQGGTGAQPGIADRQQALRRELDRQRQTLPGAGTQEGDAARDALGRAGTAMDGAEEALRADDIPGALDRQSDAMEALREGMRSLDEAMAQGEGAPGQEGGQGQAGMRGDIDGSRRDPLGRESGSQGQSGTDQQLLQGEDVYRRAEELLDEIRRRSGEQIRPEEERDYLRRLLDRF